MARVRCSHVKNDGKQCKAFAQNDKQTCYNHTKHECPICYNTVSSHKSSLVTLECKHKFCRVCIVSWLSSSHQNNMRQPHSCPMCREPISNNKLRSICPAYKLNTYLLPAFTISAGTAHQQLSSIQEYILHLMQTH